MMRLLSADVLRALTAQRGYSRRTLADLCGLSGTGMIDHLLAGRRTTCSPDLAVSLSRALGVPVRVLFVPRVAGAKAFDSVGRRLDLRQVSTEGPSGPKHPNVTDSDTASPARVRRVAGSAVAGRPEERSA